MRLACASAGEPPGTAPLSRDPGRPERGAPGGGRRAGPRGDGKAGRRRGDAPPLPLSPSAGTTRHAWRFWSSPRLSHTLSGEGPVPPLGNAAYQPLGPRAVRRVETYGPWRVETYGPWRPGTYGARRPGTYGPWRPGTYGARRPGTISPHSTASLRTLAFCVFLQTPGATSVDAREGPLRVLSPIRPVQMPPSPRRPHPCGFWGPVIGGTGWVARSGVARSGVTQPWLPREGLVERVRGPEAWPSGGPSGVWAATAGRMSTVLAGLCPQERPLQQGCRGPVEGEGRVTLLRRSPMLARSQSALVVRMGMGPSACCPSHFFRPPFRPPPAYCPWAREYPRSPSKS